MRLLLDIGASQLGCEAVEGINDLTRCLTLDRVIAIDKNDLTSVSHLDLLADGRAFTLPFRFSGHHSLISEGSFRDRTWIVGTTLWAHRQD